VPTQICIQYVPAVLSCGLKRPEHEADHLSPSNAEVYNAWSFTSTPPIHLHGTVYFPFKFYTSGRFTDVPVALSKLTKRRRRLCYHIDLHVLLVSFFFISVLSFSQVPHSCSPQLSSTSSSILYIQSFFPHLYRLIATAVCLPLYFPHYHVFSRDSHRSSFGWIRYSRGKGKVASVLLFNWARRHEGVLGAWRYRSTHSFNSALAGGEWLVSRPRHFTPRETAPSTHCIGG
jgi:hypothetical protein